MEPVTNETDTNAYRIEAQEKMAEAARLQQEAEVLEQKANELEGVKPSSKEKTEEEPKTKMKLFNK